MGAPTPLLIPVSDSLGLGWSLRICISSKFQGAAAGLRATPSLYHLHSPFAQVGDTTRKEAKVGGPSPAMPQNKLTPGRCQPKALREEPPRPKHSGLAGTTCSPPSPLNL